MKKFGLMLVATAALLVTPAVLKAGPHFSFSLNLGNLFPPPCCLAPVPVIERHVFVAPPMVFPYHGTTIIREYRAPCVHHYYPYYPY